MSWAVNWGKQVVKGQAWGLVVPVSPPDGHHVTVDPGIPGSSAGNSILERQGEIEDPALLDQADSMQYALGSDVIQRPDLILWTPFSPVVLSGQKLRRQHQSDQQHTAGDSGKHENLLGNAL